MARKRAQSSVDRDIQRIVSSASAEISRLVRRHIADELTRLVRAAGGVAEAGGARGGARKRRVILCPVQGCGKPGGGPKWGWFCTDHKDLPLAEKNKARRKARVRYRQGRKKKG